MLSCGFRSNWRACMSTQNPQKGASYDYDKLVLPLLCVSGPVVYVGAGMVTETYGASRVCVWAGGLRVLCVCVCVRARAAAFVGAASSATARPQPADLTTWRGRRALVGRRPSCRVGGPHRL